MKKGVANWFTKLQQLTKMSTGRNRRSLKGSVKSLPRPRPWESAASGGSGRAASAATPTRPRASPKAKNNPYAVQGRDDGICSSQRSTPNPLASVKIRPINVPHAMRFEKSRPRASGGTMALIKECQAGPGAELINPWIKNQANTNVKRGGVERSAATTIGSHANRPRPAQTTTIRLRDDTFCKRNSPTSCMGWPMSARDVNNPICSLLAPSARAKAARNGPVNNVAMPVVQTASATRRRVRLASFLDDAVRSATRYRRSRMTFRPSMEPRSPRAGTKTVVASGGGGGPWLNGRIRTIRGYCACATNAVRIWVLHYRAQAHWSAP